VKAKDSGIVKEVDSKNVSIIAKILGAPVQKKSGMYLYKKSGEKVEAGETIMTLYSQAKQNLEEAKDSLNNFPMLSYE